MPDRHSYIRLAITAETAAVEAAIRAERMRALGMEATAIALAALSQIEQGRAAHARAKAVGTRSVA